MNPRLFGLLDMAIVGVPVVAIILWQLVAIRREIRRDSDAKAKASDAASPEGSRHPVGEHRLDDR